jgi:RNA polymerase sigma-70 factor, ECF subfamily
MPLLPSNTSNNAERADSTRELVTRAQSGDVHAFELLLAEHIAQVRRYARAFANDEADADDLAQEALVKVYRSLQSFRFQSAFSTWLYTLVRNTFLDVVKSRGHKERSLQTSLDHERDQTEDGETAADEALILSEQHATIWAAIRRVPTEFQTALVLFEVEGMSHEEIAQIENVAIGTVKSRLSRARQHLRSILVDDPRSRHTPTGNPHGLNVVSPKEAQ